MLTKEEVLEKNNIEYVETNDIEEYLGDLDILYMGLSSICFFFFLQKYK